MICHGITYILLPIFEKELYNLKKFVLNNILYLNKMFLYQTRSLIIIIHGIDDPSLDEIIYAFKEKLEEFRKRIEGFRVFNYREKKFLVMFKLSENSMMGEAKDIVHATCSDGYTTTNDITIKSYIPQQPADLITLYPVPFEMTETHLCGLERRGWGKIEKITFANYDIIKTSKMVMLTYILKTQIIYKSQTK